MRWGVVAVMASACGRLSFDPLGNPTGTTDGGAIDDSVFVTPIDAAPGTLLPAPTGDAYFQSSSTVRHGIESAFICGRTASGGSGGADQRSVIRFDLAGVPTTVQTATLRLYLGASLNATNLSLSIYRVTMAWDEPTVTWTQASSSATWTAGGAFAPSEYTAASLGSAANGYYDWNVTTLVNEWTSGAQPNFGLELAPTTQPAGGTSAIFDSREHPNVSVRPQLLITP